MRAFYFLISLVAARRVKKGLKNTETEHDYEFEGAGIGGTPDGIFGGGELSDLFMGDSYEEDDWYYPAESEQDEFGEYSDDYSSFLFRYDFPFFETDKRWNENFDHFEEAEEELESYF